MDKFRRNFSKVLEHFQSLLEPILSKVSHLGRFWTFLSRSEAFWGYIKCSGALFKRFPGASRALDLAQVDLGRSGRPGRRWRATRAHLGRSGALDLAQVDLRRSGRPGRRWRAARALMGARPRPGRRSRAPWAHLGRLWALTGVRCFLTPKSVVDLTQVDLGHPWCPGRRW